MSHSFHSPGSTVHGPRRKMARWLATCAPPRPSAMPQLLQPMPGSCRAKWTARTEKPQLVQAYRMESTVLAPKSESRYRYILRATSIRVAISPLPNQPPYPRAASTRQENNPFSGSWQSTSLDLNAFRSRLPATHGWTLGEPIQCISHTLILEHKSPKALICFFLLRV